METFFAHSALRADIVGGVVRVEFVKYQPIPSLESSEPATRITQRVTHEMFMPLEGFLNTMSVLGGLMQQCAKAGLIKQAAPDQPPDQPPQSFSQVSTTAAAVAVAAVAPATTPQASQASSRVSPNFD
jgi:hypothetical protein